MLFTEGSCSINLSSVHILCCTHEQSAAKVAAVSTVTFQRSSVIAASVVSLKVVETACSEIMLTRVFCFSYCPCFFKHVFMSLWNPEYEFCMVSASCSPLLLYIDWKQVTSCKSTTEEQIICLYLFSSEHNFNHCSSSFHTFRKDHDLWDCFINHFIKVVCRKIKEVTWTKASIILQYTGSIIVIIIIIIAMIFLYAFEPLSSL